MDGVFGTHRRDTNDHDALRLALVVAAAHWPGRPLARHMEVVRRRYNASQLKIVTDFLAITSEVQQAAKECSKYRLPQCTCMMDCASYELL
jgi:hypothetical protein